MRRLVVLLCAACGSSAALPDAPPDVPDGPPPPAPLERLDFRTTRGAPIATGFAATPAAALFAIAGDGFVSRADCQALGCTYSWRDLAGAERLHRAHMTAVTVTSASPDGRRALLVATDAVERCADADGTHPVARGALQLLDLATGAVGFELALRTNLWSAPAFTPHGDWMFAAPIDGKACVAERLGHRAVATPNAPPPALDASMELVLAVEPRRWLVFRNFDLGLVDPQVPGTFAFLADDPAHFEATAGWVHVYVGFGDLAQDVLSVPPTGAMRQTTLRDEDWFPFGAWGRWIRVCRARQPDGTRACRVADALGEARPVDFRVTVAPDHPDDAVLLDGAVVFVGPSGDAGDRAVQRIELATGRRDVLRAGTGTLRPLGDGAAALLVQDGVAWLVEPRGEERITDGVTRVITAPRVAQRALGRQDDLALLVQSGTGGAAPVTLTALDLRTRRLATLTDDAFVTATAAPFAFDDGCGQPWTTRHAGGVLDGLSQTPAQLYFVEQGQPAALWLAPIDLSAPPRRLGTLAGHPTACHAPLVSPDGRAGFAEDLADGTTRFTLSSAK